MNDHQVSQLVATLEGAYPQSKISPSKVQATLQSSKRLQAFNNAHRADLINYVLKAHRFFPSLPEIMDACDAVEPREREGDCLACNGLAYIHHTPAGEELRRPHRVTTDGRTVTFEYAGKAIEYAYVEPCPICNTWDRR